MKHKNIKTAVSSLLIALAIYFVGSFVIVMLIYEGLFAASEEYEYRSFMSYEDMEKYYSGQEITFYSKSNALLSGKIYNKNNSDRLVILGHKKDDDGEDMLAEAKFFCDNGFSALIFDGTGQGGSQGFSQTGLHQAVRDMEEAIVFAKSEGFSEIYLYGIGMGGYAAAACSDIDGVKAAASISAFSSVSAITIDYAKENMGIFGYLEYPVMMLYQFLIYGSELENDAISSINGANVPIIIIHGTEDALVGCDDASIISKSDKITNENAVFRTVEGGLHGSLMRSEAAVLLLEKFNEEAYELYNSYGGAVPTDLIENLYAAYDREEMSELDSELMNEVLAVFNSASK